MKLRATISVLAIAAAISACSSSSNGGGGPTSAGVPAPTSGGAVPVTTAAGEATGASGDFCANLTSANNKLSELPTAASGGDFNALKAAIGQEITAFQSLSNGAPASVKPSIDDIVGVLQQAQGAVADPTHPDVTKLQGLATKLPNDLTALANYIGTNCTGG